MVDRFGHGRIPDFEVDALTPDVRSEARAFADGVARRRPLDLSRLVAGVWCAATTTQMTPCSEPRYCDGGLSVFAGTIARATGGESNPVALSFR